jgi:hypothetical protein
MDAVKVFDYCEHKGIQLAFEDTIPEQAEVSDYQIRFNGVGNDGHETFILKKSGWEFKDVDRPNHLQFNFCKTARKPYDLAVGLVLLVAKNHSPNSIRVSSDGDWESDWKEIRDSYNEIFKKYPECPW